MCVFKFNGFRQGDVAQIQDIPHSCHQHLSNNRASSDHRL